MDEAQVRRAISRLVAENAQLAAEVRRLQARDEAARQLLDAWSVLRKYADRYPLILVGALDELRRVQDEDQ